MVEMVVIVIWFKTKKEHDTEQHQNPIMVSKAYFSFCYTKEQFELTSL